DPNAARTRAPSPLAPNPPAEPAGAPRTAAGDDCAGFGAVAVEAPPLPRRAKTTSSRTTMMMNATATTSWGATVASAYRRTRQLLARGDSGDRCRLGRLVVEPLRDHLGGAVVVERDAVEHARDLHRPLLVGDD